MSFRPAPKTLQQLADGLAADLGAIPAAWSPFAPQLQAAALLPALRVRSALRSTNPRHAWASAREAAETLHGLLDLGRRCGLVSDEFATRAHCLRDALGALAGEGPASAGMRI